MTAITSRAVYLTLQIALLGGIALPVCALTQSASYQQGVAAMDKNDLKTAINSFDQSVTNDSTDWQSFLKRGQCLYQLGDYKLAISDFSTVVSLKPKNTDALLWRANSYAKLGQSDKALNDYKQTIQIDPTKIAVLSQRATFTVQRQLPADPDQPAQTSASTGAVPSAAAAPAVLHLRAALFAGSKDPNHAINELNSAISLDPKNPQLLYRRAQAYIQLKKNDTALNDMSDAIMNNPNNASYYLARAWVYHVLGNDVLATEDIRQAQFCDPGLPKTIDFENPDKKASTGSD